MQQHQVTANNLAEQWRKFAAQQRRIGAEPQARLLEYCADELTAAFMKANDELLGLRAASQESGYSVDHLARLVREGKIPNSGRKAKPLIRRSDLPCKGGRSKTLPCSSPPNDYIPNRLFRDVIHSKFGGDDAQE